MNAKQRERALKRIEIMDDARRRQIRSLTDAISANYDSITGKRRYATYERQVDRFADAAIELKSLVGILPAVSLGVDVP